MLKKKSEEKQILSNNENKALINNLIDQIEFLKNELLAKTPPFSSLSKIQNVVTNISKIKIITIVIKLKNSSHQNNCKTQNIRQLTLTTLHPLAVLNYQRIKKQIIKKTNNNEHEDSIRHSAAQLENSTPVQSQVSVKKSTFSKPKALTTVILGDSIVKNLYSNIVTKSVKHQKQVVVQNFSGGKLQI